MLGGSAAFEALGVEDPQLTESAAHATEVASRHPAAALSSLRTFGELLARQVGKRNRLPQLEDESAAAFFSRLRREGGRRGTSSLRFGRRCMCGRADFTARDHGSPGGQAWLRQCSDEDSRRTSAGNRESNSLRRRTMCRASVRKGYRNNNGGCGGCGVCSEAVIAENRARTDRIRENRRKRKETSRGRTQSIRDEMEHKGATNRGNILQSRSKR
jgi:hypothetical protein